jgi:hypothetical protein
MKDKFKIIKAITGPIGFIILGTHLVQKTDIIEMIIGYVNICFWSILLLFTFYKLITKKLSFFVT